MAFFLPALELKTPENKILYEVFETPDCYLHSLFDSNIDNLEEIAMELNKQGIYTNITDRVLRFSILKFRYESGPDLSNQILLIDALLYFYFNYYDNTYADWTVKMLGVQNKVYFKNNTKSKFKDLAPSYPKDKFVKIILGPKDQ